MCTIGIDVGFATLSFDVCEMHGARHVTRRRELRRDALALGWSQLASGTFVAIEGA